MNIQKYTTIALVLALLGLGGALFWEKKNHSEDVSNLKNKLAETQQLVKETQTAFGSAAIELNNLKASNADLQKVINKNKEQILASTNVALQWKDKYYNIKNSQQDVVDQARNTTIFGSF